MLSNKILSEKLGIPITKIRRNTKEFLGEDPVARRRTGFKREFTANEGFFVFLGGYLVSQLGLSFEGARQALETLKPWLLLTGFVPEIPDKAIRLGADRMIHSAVVVSFFPLIGKNFVFRVSGLAKFEQVENKDCAGRLFETVRETNIGYNLTTAFENEIMVYHLFGMDRFSSDTRNIIIDRNSNEMIPKKDIPIMFLIQKYIANVFDDEKAVNWFSNWKELGEKNPQNAENLIKKYEKKYNRNPSYSEILNILNVNIF